MSPGDVTSSPGASFKNLRRRRQTVSFIIKRPGKEVKYTKECANAFRPQDQGTIVNNDYLSEVLSKVEDSSQEDQRLEQISRVSPDRAGNLKMKGKSMTNNLPNIEEETIDHEPTPSKRATKPKLPRKPNRHAGSEYTIA